MQQNHLPNIETSFKDYVQYKNSLKETKQYMKEKQFWIDKIPTLPSAPKLPMIDKESKDGSYQFRRFEGKLNKSKWEFLKKNGKEKDLSPSGVVALILCEVLRLWNESNDFTLNFPVSDRLPVSDDIDNIVGDFTNTLLVPYKVDKNLTLEEKGAVLQKEIWDALDNRLFTGVEVLRELSRRNRNGKEPLMPVVLTSLLGHPKRHDVSLLGEEVYGVSQTPQVTLDVQIRESEGDLIFKWDYLTNAIKPTVVKDMFEMFSKLLNDLSEDVSIWKKKTLSLLPDYQRKQRELINSTEVTVPDIDLKKLLLNKLIERPNEICLIHKNYKYSWKELINESKKLSKLINKFRTLKKEFVGILLPKSVYQYQAVYGCLLSNVGYIPIDINLPKKRINTIIKKANIKTVITNKEMELHIPNLNKIEVEAARLDVLISSLLKLAQTEFDNKGLIIEPIRIDELLLSVKQNFNNIHPENNIVFDFSLLPENPDALIIQGNKSLLSIAFSNVLDNAGKFSGNQKVIIKIETTSKTVQITITDMGMGIPKDELKNIFEPFYRATNVRGVKGFGVGLPLTYRIVKLHSGQLQIDSDVEKGTVVKFSFPNQEHHITILR